MCPACIATTVWIAAGAASAGGATTLAVRRLRSRGGRTDEDSTAPTFPKPDFPNEKEPPCDS